MLERSAVARAQVLAGGAAAAIAILVGSTELTGNQAPPWAFALVVIASGAALGFGRQGVDLLAIRAGVAAFVTLACWVGIDTVLKGAAACPPGQAAHCSGHLVAGVLVGGVLLAIPLAVAGVITNVVLGRGAAQLRPELGWSRVLPKRPWHWVLLGVLLIVGIPTLLILLDVPFPA